MHENEINCFDFYSSKQRERFELLKKHREKIRIIIEWYGKNYQKAIDSGIKNNDFGWAPIANAVQFSPDEIYLRFENHRISREIASAVGSALIINPCLFFQIPEVPPALSPIDDLRNQSMLPPEFKTVLMKNFERPSAEEIEERRQQQMLKYGPAAQRIRDLLQLSEDVEYEEISVISRVVRDCAAKLEEELYFYQVFDTARQAIAQIAPSLIPALDSIADKTVLIHSAISDDGTHIDFYHAHVGDSHGIVIQKDPYRENFDSDHGYRILATGHELMHAIVDELLAVQGESPGYRDRVNTNTLTQQEIDRYNLTVVGSLKRVISEGVAIAFEHALIDIVKKSSGYLTTSTRLNEFADNRLVWIRAMNRNISPKYRASQVHDEKQKKEMLELELSDYAGFAYSEGIRLAIGLQRNMWSLNDLPELFTQIRKVLIEEAALSDQLSADSDITDLLNQTGISRDTDSLYHRVITKIRKVKKSDR